MELQFKAKVWLYRGVSASWHFVTLPKNIALKVKYLGINKRGGWGAIKVNVITGESDWETSIFPSKEFSSYILPLKAEIRNKSNIKENDIVNFKIRVV